MSEFKAKTHQIRKPGEYNIFINISADFTKIRWCMYQDLGHTH